MRLIRMAVAAAILAVTVAATPAVYHDMGTTKATTVTASASPDVYHDM
jgi:hypothetical protein